MDVSGNTRVGEIAAKVPASLEVFERYGVDFCCNGDKPLSQAVQGTGMSVGDILAEIDRAVEAEAELEVRYLDWTEESPGSLADHVVQTHHAYLDRELPRIDRDLNKVIAVHGQHHPELFELGRVYGQLQTALEDHLRKEEEQVFPLLRRLGAGDVPSPELLHLLDELEGEHDVAGDALHSIRGITSNFQTPGDACFTYSTLFRELRELEADVHRHVHLENNILIPGLKARSVEAAV